ncbi:N-acetylneuraminate synthase family protein [Puniceicoccus vermicola]|uniref:N-acetylneuraminate synthase family protein n=1 Tax=Puniceicoccus vermicola TaxID=388746 RepID=A0A7X1AW39_9BACT|nr:N-acetylneuraminate synthase family protein [Puniceicoccus vermicola]MBC2601073.1 N-acetylneuraminate synthase family protein [Puniceicoccus vermicola]
MGVHIIAEAGSNYNGSVELAKDLNTVAFDSGADSVKYQIIYPEGLYRQAKYHYGHYDISEVLRIRQEGVLSDEEWTEIFADAKQKGIPCSASAFDSKGLQLLETLNCPYLKIASSDLNNVRFLREAAAYGKTMVVSTGMSSLSDIENSVNVLSKEGIEGEKLVLLHCVSAYPSLLQDTNLSFINTLKHAFGTAVGFSDHTLSSEAACAAVTLGATWIEKHFTTDRTLSGFDHKHAAEPKVMKEYVASIRAIEASLQYQPTKIGEAENYTRQRARRGLYAARDIPAGQTITDEDILIVRPQNQMPAESIDQIVGKPISAAVKANDPIEPHHFWQSK